MFHSIPIVAKSQLFRFLLVVFLVSLPYSVLGVEKSVRTINNCNYEDKNICYDCADGYTISKDQTQCIKCSIKDCYECSNDGKSCVRCKDGLAFDSKTKSCVACKVANCQTCDKDVNKCTKCAYGLKTGIHYGLVGGACVPCADQHAVTCDNKKVTQCEAGYYVAQNACNACVSPCVSCESATTCDYCGNGYQLKAVNGKCIPLGNLESETAPTASTKSAAVPVAVGQSVALALASWIYVSIMNV